MPETEGSVNRRGQPNSGEGAAMSQVIAQAPTGSERLENELDLQLSKWRRWDLVRAVFQSAPLRWGLPGIPGHRSDSDFSKVLIYPGV